nr:MAG TPA: lipoprotein [Bacteriophage sp.]
MKMRYLAVLLLSAVLLVGCGNNTTTKSGNTEVDTTTETKQKESLADMMETKEYSCTVDDSFMYYVMYVTNNSDKVVSIDLNVTALDSSGSMVGSSSDGTKAIAPGQTAGIWTTFDEWDKISSFDYTMSVNEEKDFSPVYDDLSIDYNTTDTGIVASVTNNGESPADFVWMDVVYLKDGEMVNFSELSFMDDNQELQPGTTLSQEGTCYSDSGFDDVVIAINGRK